MNRKSRHQTTENPVSLFPFLAVLLCTMGMLVMLLVLMSQSTHRSQQLPEEAARELLIAQTGHKIDLPAESQAEKEPLTLNETIDYYALEQLFKGATNEELLTETESSDWFLEELREIGRRTSETLQTQRDRLAAAESAISARYKEVQRLQLEAQLLTEKNGSLTEKELQEKIRLYQTQLEQLELLRAEISRLQAEDKTPSKSFSITPYQGKSGTIRRPIFIECRENGVRLMPEGVEFSYEDFLLARYPGNPFDTAIRAARTAMINENKNTQTPLEPYPLLIIRPGGADKYYIAMAALASWGGEFGYEFVENDWEIEYPERDLQRTMAINQQVDISRQKLAIQLAMLLAEQRETGLPGGEGRFGGGNTDSLAHAGDAGPGGSGPGGGGSFVSPLQGQLGNNVRLSPISNSAGTILPADTGTVFPNSPGIVATGFSGTAGAAQAGNTGTTSSDWTTTPLPAYQGSYQGTSQGNYQGATQGGYQGTGQMSYQGTETTVAAGAVSPPINNGVTSVETTTATGAATTNAPSAQIVSMIQEQQKREGATAPVDTNYWETVGNTAYMQDPPVGNATNRDGTAGATSPGSTMAGSSLTSDSQSGGTPALPMLNKTQELNKPKPSDNPGYSNSTDYAGAINLSEKLRVPVNSLVERPIRVECYADRIVFPKQPGLKVDQVIPLGDTAKVNQQLLETVAFCVKSWGVAGRNMYWTPWLKVSGINGGEESVRRLEQFFHPQGIAVKRDGAL